MDEDEAPRRRHRRDREWEDDEGGGRSPGIIDSSLNGPAIGGIACISLPLISVVGQFIPLVNLVPCALPALAGLGGGAVAWAVAALVAHKRVPLGTMMLAGLATMLGVYIPGVLLAVLVAMGAIIAGVIIFIVSPSYLGYFALLLAYYGALIGFGLVTGLAQVLAWTLTAVVLGVLGTRLGRPLEDDETRLNLDLFSVPPPQSQDGED